MEESRIHLIGHSLGAHISGYVGSDLDGKIGRISGRLVLWKWVNRGSSVQFLIWASNYISLPLYSACLWSYLLFKAYGNQQKVSSWHTLGEAEPKTQQTNNICKPLTLIFSFFYYQPLSVHGWTRPSSSLFTGCVVSLRGDWAIFCHAGSG